MSGAPSKNPPRKAGSMSHVQNRVGFPSPQLPKAVDSAAELEDRGRRLEHAANHPFGNPQNRHEGGQILGRENRIVAERKAAAERGELYQGNVDEFERARRITLFYTRRTTLLRVSGTTAKAAIQYG